MTKQAFGKDAWVEMFRAVGLDEATMGRWHHAFETKWPDDHERFLAWLGLPPNEVARVSRGAQGPAHP
jgi:hypothetical protein